jgi:hypothetical protein
LKHVLEQFLDPEEDKWSTLTLEAKQIAELEQFFLTGREFDFSQYKDCFCGFSLFNNFSDYVTEQNKDAFLRTVWNMFYDYRKKTDWHNWNGQFLPGGGALFFEGFLKYELCLAGHEPCFDDITAIDHNWFDTTTEFLAAAKRYSNKRAYELFIHQFARNLADTTNMEVPSLGSIQKMIRNGNQETIVHALASLACLGAKDFDKINLGLIPDGKIELLI